MLLPDKTDIYQIYHIWEKEDSTESTLKMMTGFSDRCSDNDVYARIILPLLHHYTCGMTPGVTATRWGLGPRLI